MQLAINAVLFVVAFLILFHLIQFQRTIDQLIKKLRSATKDLKLGTLPSKRDAGVFASELLSGSHIELLTRFVSIIVDLHCEAYMLSEMTSKDDSTTILGKDLHIMISKARY
jgi:hypothetical protein